MKHKLLVKIISVIAAVSLLFTAGTATANEAASLEKQRRELQTKLAETDKKLAELGEQSKETEAYIKTLGNKIACLTKEYDYAKQETANIENEVAALEQSIADNEQKIISIGAQVEALEQNITELDAEFSSVYSAYCSRMRAIYISGQQGSVISFLLTSDGVGSFITRLQMVTSVAKQDGELLQKVQLQSAKITKSKTALSDKEAQLKSSQIDLKNNKAQLKRQRTELLEKQEKLGEQQAVIEVQQAEQNRILQQLHDKTKKYGEFRDTTKEELDAIDADIAAADEIYRAPETTTKAPAEPTTAKAAETTTKSEPEYISLTYPCPQYTAITCGFGAYEGHTGCDFSTGGNVNCKIVAAESGTVILVKILDYSYGHYVVIRHDKTTPGGKAVYTLYAHNNDIIVTPGQHVNKGQQIAYSGSTGNSTGPHCHFEVRIGGADQYSAQNPANYLP